MFKTKTFILPPTRELNCQNAISNSSLKSSIISTSTTLSPPTYDQTERAAARKPVPNSELITFELQGELIIILNSNEILFELLTAPLAGSGSDFSIQRVTYKTTRPGSSNPEVRATKDLIYRVKDTKFSHPVINTSSLLDLTPQGASKSYLKGPVAIIKGKPVPFLPWMRYGESWHIVTLADLPVLSSFKYKKQGTTEYRDKSGKVLTI
jgi:hypothetical protein